MKILVTIIVLTLVFPILALAQDCPDLIYAECGGGSAWFGLRGDGANVGQGQTVLLPCPAYLLSVEFYFLNNGAPNQGVPPLVTGDPINVTVFDLDMNVYGTATAPMPFDVGEDWIQFSFDNLELEAGLYLFAAYTDVPGQCGFAFCPDQDPYPDGERYATLGGFNGPWIPWYGIFDVPFRVYLDSGPLADNNQTWGTVKALYR